MERFQNIARYALNIAGASQIQTSYGSDADSMSSAQPTSGSRGARLFIHIETDPASNITSYEFQVLSANLDADAAGNMIAVATSAVPIIGRLANDTARTWAKEFSIATGGVGQVKYAQVVFEEPDICSTQQVYVEVKATGGAVKAGDVVKCWLVF